VSDIPTSPEPTNEELDERIVDGDREREMERMASAVDDRLFFDRLEFFGPPDDDGSTLQPPRWRWR
jgi:hypothetical protein